MTVNANRRQRPFFVALFSLLIIGSAAAQEAEPLTVEQLVGLYDAAIGKLMAEHDRKLIILDDAYMEKLVAIEAWARNRGDLENLLIVKGEKERFAAALSIPDTALVESPKQLRELQGWYQRSTAKNYLVESQGIVELTERYIQSLDRRQRQLTVDDKIDAALAARKVKDAAAKATVYRLAKERLAERRPAEDEKASP